MTNAKLKARNEFGVRHYAGEVVYNVKGFLEKNKDSVPPDALALVTSPSSILAPFFEEEAAELAAAAKLPASKRSTALNRPSLGSQFRTQLEELMGTIRSTAPHYIRCLKANPKNLPRLINRKLIVDQLRCGGVLEAVKVARVGYPVKLPLSAFLSRYRTIVSDSDLPLPRMLSLIHISEPTRPY